MATFLQGFFDDLADSSLALLTDAGNGSFAETTFLRISCPLAVNCEWWTGTNNAPVAYEKVHNYAPAGTVYRATMRMTGFTASGNNIFPGLVVWNDRDNAYMMGFDNTSSNQALNRKLAGTASGLQNTTGLSSPNTTPHRYRAYWNKSSQNFIVPDDGYLLPPGWIAWYRSVDDGVSYVRVHSRALEFEIERFGVYAYTYGALPSLDADFDWLELEYVDPNSIADDENVAGITDATTTNPEDRYGARGGEDFFVGPKSHQLGHATGVLVPGPPDQPLGSIGPFDTATTEDAEQRLDPGGDAGHGELLGLGYLIGIAQTNKRLSPVAAMSDSQADEVATLCSETDYSDQTTDADFNAHFNDKEILGAFFYDTTGEDWANPVASGMTGYARDGTRYTSGVQDGGPVNAPWATEAFSTTRGNRNDFPEQALVVWTANDITIFDLTNFPTSLTMWMRFSVNASFSMIGRNSNNIQDVKMLNGVLYLVTVWNGTDQGRLFIIDFKGDTTANTAHLIGWDNHWRWNGDITARNGASIWVTAGVSPSLRGTSDYLYSVHAYKDPTQNKVWYAIAGDDHLRVIEVLDGIPQHSYVPAEKNTPVNIGDGRNVLFDERGWLWTSEQKRLVRNVFAYQGGSIIIQDHDNVAQTDNDLYHKLITIPHDIRHMAAARNYIYCATDVGIYRIARGSMAWELYFSIVDGGGTKEVIFGDNPVIKSLSSFSFLNSSYLSVATERGVTLIRLFDAVALVGITHSDLDEVGANFNVATWD